MSMKREFSRHRFFTGLSLHERISRLLVSIAIVLAN